MAPQVKCPNVDTLDPVYTDVSPMLGASENVKLELNPAYAIVEDVAGETSGDGIYEDPVWDETSI